jgi:hypothetical protein
VAVLLLSRSRLSVNLFVCPCGSQDDEESTPTKQTNTKTITAANNLDPDATPRISSQKAAEAEEETTEEKLELVEESQLGKAISRQLKDVYIPLELWYLRSAIERVSLIIFPSTRRYSSSTALPSCRLIKWTNST